MINMKKLFNKSFWIGFVAGILFVISMFLGFCYWIDRHPVTDCDSCLHGTTP